MKFFFTTEQSWFDKWDEFLTKESRGTHLQHSVWLNSYKSYGFTTELFLLVEENNDIIGGFIAVIAKKAFFKFYIIPQGPIIKLSKEFYLKDCFEQIHIRSKHLKCCYAQFSIPISNNLLIKDYVYGENVREWIPEPFESGNKFKYIYSGYGMNWVDLSEFTDFDSYLKSLKSQVRRNIKLAYQRNDDCYYLSNKSTIDDLELLYELVLLNAKQFHYSVRSFKDVGNSLLNLLYKGQGVFQSISNNSEIVSTGFSIKHHNYLVYLFGGTKRMKPDTKSGYLIHASNIKMSIENGYPGYNISMGGSEGVRDFKRKFASEEIYFNKPHYFCVHNALVFNIFKSFEKILKKHKGVISKYLK
ncbi:hypothetical protein DI383_02295 [Flavobacteriaceae bacterium LYZ1037]|nr:hypothetical protein DI383_02295 [Flavobacteriaceae bacterium LYZ1037]